MCRAGDSSGFSAALPTAAVAGAGGAALGAVGLAASADTTDVNEPSVTAPDVSAPKLDTPDMPKVDVPTAASPGNSPTTPADASFTLRLDHASESPGSLTNADTLSVPLASTSTSNAGFDPRDTVSPGAGPLHALYGRRDDTVSIPIAPIVEAPSGTDSQNAAVQRGGSALSGYAGRPSHERADAGVLATSSNTDSAPLHNSAALDSPTAQHIPNGEDLEEEARYTGTLQPETADASTFEMSPRAVGVKPDPLQHVSSLPEMMLPDVPEESIVSSAPNTARSSLASSSTVLPGVPARAHTSTDEPVATPKPKNGGWVPFFVRKRTDVSPTACAPAVPTVDAHDVPEPVPEVGIEPPKVLHDSHTPDRGGPAALVVATPVLIFGPEAVDAPQADKTPKAGVVVPNREIFPDIPADASVDSVVPVVVTDEPETGSAVASLPESCPEVRLSLIHI